MGAGTRTRLSSVTCGAPTSTGGRCERRVADGGRCPLHAGLSSGAGSSVVASSGSVTVTAARPQPRSGTYRVDSSAPAAPTGLADLPTSDPPTSDLRPPAGLNVTAGGGGGGGWRERLSAANQAWGRWKCRHGLHKLRPAPDATVDDNFCHDEQCRRCGKVVKIAYSGI